jgi:hypothetical protein
MNPRASFSLLFRLFLEAGALVARGMVYLLKSAVKQRGDALVVGFGHHGGGRHAAFLFPALARQNVGAAGGRTLELPRARFLETLGNGFSGFLLRHN